MPCSAPPPSNAPPPDAPPPHARPSLRRRLARLLGARAPALQVAAICMDRATGRILMITSRGTGRWIIPKGWPMAGHTLAGAALQEAWEEAGVRARAGHDLGVYHYDKIQDHGFAIPIKVQVFLAHVDSLADDYPEAGKRRRQWFTPADAAGLVAEPELAALMLTLATDAPPGPCDGSGSGPAADPAGTETAGGTPRATFARSGSGVGGQPGAQTTPLLIEPDLLSEDSPAGGFDAIRFPPTVAATADSSGRRGRKAGKSGKAALAKAAVADRMIDLPLATAGTPICLGRKPGLLSGKDKNAKPAPEHGTHGAPVPAEPTKKRRRAKSGARGGLIGLSGALDRAPPGTA